jgi:hypothetical protein
MNTVLSPEHLEVAAHSLTALLGTWLAVTVLTRTSAPAPRVFGILAFALVAWSSSVIVQRLTDSVTAGRVGHSIEELAAALIVPVTAHFALIVATEGHPSFRARLVLGLAYVLNIGFAVPGALNPGAPIAIAAPHLDPGFVPGTVLGWAWIITRLAILTASIWLLVDWFRRARPGDPRRRQFAVTLATVAIGATGGIIRIVNVIGATEAWIGVSLVTVAMILSASVVFSGGVFFDARVADRAFRRSLSLGIGLVVLVAGLIMVDAASRQLLGVNAPLLTGVVLVGTVAIYEPAASWGRRRLGGRSPTSSP